MTIEQKFEMIKQLHKEIDEEISLLNNFVSIEKQYLGHITHSKQI